jgi:hypothetical protein
MHAVHLAHIVHKTHRNVGFCGMLLMQAQTRPAVVPERKQTTGMHVICCNALQFAWMETRSGGSVYSRLNNARCTAVNGSVFTECTTDRLCFMWERRAIIVTR